MLAQTTRASSCKLLVLCAVLLVAGVTLAGDAKGHKRGELYNFGLPYRVTDVVNMTISANHQVKSLQIGLFGKTVPKTVANFKALCQMTRGFGYVNSTFHRVLREFIVQGGDFEFHNGKGGYSIYNDNPGRRFSAENYNAPHRFGSVAMASESKTRLGSQFYMVAAADDEVRYLNGKHVVFGHVIHGLTSVLQKLARVATTRHDAPKSPIRISACSVETIREAVDPQAANNSSTKKVRLLDDDVGHDDDRKEGPQRRKSAVAADVKPKLTKNAPPKKGPEGEGGSELRRKKPEIRMKKERVHDLNLNPEKPSTPANTNNKPTLS